MDFTDDAIVLSIRRHGESDAILSALTRQNGRHLGLVKAGASRRQRAVLEIGNRLKVHWRARLAEQLGNFQVELVTSVSSGLFDDPLRLAALASACAVADIVLPEREPHEDVFTATTELIAAIVGGAPLERATPTPPSPNLGEGEESEARRPAASEREPHALQSPPPSWGRAPSANADLVGVEGVAGSEDASDSADTPWPAAYVRWELDLLASLGFGLDLSHCAATGETRDLAYVSPKTGRAVGREAGRPYVDRLLVLPPFLTAADGAPDIADLMAGLRLTGYFLDRHVLHGPNTDRRLEARARFVERLAVQP
ncbi:MAG TPA: DNA repair protein RecO C-terminal domain-containing protein [Dongiaceae bacterium]|jgi:DNA repair protein RecO (recombination protein O)